MCLFQFILLLFDRPLLYPTHLRVHRFEPVGFVLASFICFNPSGTVTSQSGRICPFLSASTRARSVLKVKHG